MNIFTYLMYFIFTTHAQVTFGIIGDAGEKNPNSLQVMNSLINQKVDHLILPGDNLYSSTYALIWKDWLKNHFEFSIVAIGNHNAGYEAEIAFFKMPNEYFKKVYGPATFFVLNSDNIKNVSSQMKWLEKELDSSSSELIFLVYHHPSYTISQVHKSSEKKEFQEALRPLLKKFRKKITSLIVGHDHIASLVHFDDLPVLVSGAVQETREDKPIDTVEDQVRVKTAWYFKRKPHWAKLTLHSTSAQVDFIDAETNESKCTATLKPNSMAQLFKNCKSQN